MFNTKLSFQDSLKLSSYISLLKKESQDVRFQLYQVGKKLIESYPSAPKDIDAKQEFEFTDSERISVYRMVISVLSEAEYEQKIISWSATLAELFGFQNQLKKKFKLDKDISVDKDFMFDEEFEILDEEPNPDLAPV